MRERGATTPRLSTVSPSFVACSLVQGSPASTMGQAESVPAEGEAPRPANRTAAHPSALVVVGPSGVGKGTLIARLMEGDPRFGFSCSHTTRPPREGEVVSDPSAGVGAIIGTQKELRAPESAGWPAAHAVPPPPPRSVLISVDDRRPLLLRRTACTITTPRTRLSRRTSPPASSWSTRTCTRTSTAPPSRRCKTSPILGAAACSTSTCRARGRWVLVCAGDAAGRWVLQEGLVRACMLLSSHATALPPSTRLNVPLLPPCPLQVRKSGLKAIFVFIAPPSLEELEARLRGRATGASVPSAPLACLPVSVKTPSQLHATLCSLLAGACVLHACLCLPCCPRTAPHPDVRPLSLAPPLRLAPVQIARNRSPLGCATPRRKCRA